VQGKQPPRRVTGVQQHQREFAEFYAATIQAAWALVPVSAPVSCTSTPPKLPV
jgi:hypothetical protein